MSQVSNERDVFALAAIEDEDASMADLIPMVDGVRLDGRSVVLEVEGMIKAALVARGGFIFTSASRSSRGRR